MRKKFTYKDSRDWQVVDVNGQVLCLVKKDKEGKEEAITRFDGFRSANFAALKLGGTAVRV